MSKPSGGLDELDFEKALAELEKIVARMESGELSLEQALATHKRGLELARFCQQKLEAAQQQVKVLEGEVLKPLAAAAEPDKLDFERALAELEKIVARMESGELSLEQALATHKRGLELARFCQQKLEAAQQQVKVLEGEVLKPLEKVTPEDSEDR